MAGELKVIGDCYDLAVYLSRRVEKFPRSHRYTLGADIERRVQGLLGDLVRALRRGRRPTVVAERRAGTGRTVGGVAVEAAPGSHPRRPLERGANVRGLPGLARRASDRQRQRPGVPGQTRANASGVFPSSLVPRGGSAAADGLVGTCGPGGFSAAHRPFDERTAKTPRTPRDSANRGRSRLDDSLDSILEKGAVEVDE